MAMGGGRIWQKGEGLGRWANWAPSASHSALTGSGSWGWRLCPLELPKPGLFLPFWSPKCHFLREGFPNQLLHLLSCFSSLGASLAALRVKNLPAMKETQVQSLSWEDPLEKGVATHSSILVWRIPWTEEPGGLQPMGLGHKES